MTLYKWSKIRHLSPPIVRKKVENKNAKRKMRKNVMPRERKFYRKKTKTWKRHKEFVLINKKSFTFLTRKLEENT